MIVLDTNVISELVRDVPDARVLAWVDAQVAETLFLTAPVFAELMLGVELLPDGKRKEALRAVIAEVRTTLFAARFLPFGENAALKYAVLVAGAAARGYRVTAMDAQIAAIAAACGFTVATRDIAPFEACGVPVIDPWGREG